MSLFRFSARKPFALAVLFCLSTALLLTGCGMGGDFVDTGFIPVGEWADSYGGSYTITNTIVEFNSGYGEIFNSYIKEAVDFSHNAGVILVQITTSSTAGQAGKFIGVYYKGYTPFHVFLANAIDASYNIIVKNTLAEAKNTFTVDNVETHVTYWGSGYNK